MTGTILKVTVPQTAPYGLCDFTDNQKERTVIEWIVLLERK
jgi:hypothetical protein